MVESIFQVKEEKKLYSEIKRLRVQIKKNEDNDNLEIYSRIAKPINNFLDNVQVNVIDDCSSDYSYELALEICSRYENFYISKNSRRLGALNNINKLLSLNIKNPSKTIDILIDGDDYLYSGDVFHILYIVIF